MTKILPRKATHLLIILIFAYSILYFTSLSGTSYSRRTLFFFSVFFFFSELKVPPGTLVISFPSVWTSPHVSSLSLVFKHGRWRKKYLQKLCYCKCQNVQGYKQIINHLKGLSWQSIKGKVFYFCENYLLSQISPSWQSDNIGSIITSTIEADFEILNQIQVRPGAW